MDFNIKKKKYDLYFLLKGLIFLKIFFCNKINQCDFYKGGG